MTDHKSRYAREDFEEAVRRLYVTSLLNGLAAAALALSSWWFATAQWAWAAFSAGLGLLYVVYIRVEDWNSGLRIGRAAVLYALLLAAAVYTLGMPVPFAEGYGLGGDPPVFSLFSLLNALFPVLILGLQAVGLLPFFWLFWRRWGDFAR